MDDDAVRNGVRRLWLIILAAAAADAVRNHRRHGELFGLVPYDFRLPTLERARDRTWAPQSERILTPTTFGVGWSVNIGRLARLAHLT